MPGPEHLPLHVVLEEVHARQQRLAGWVHDELAGNINALQLLLQSPRADGVPTPHDVLSRLRMSLGQLEDALGAAVLAHLGFSEAMSRLLRCRGLSSMIAPTLREQPLAGTAACLYRCAEHAVGAAAPGQAVCWELERVPEFWRLQLGPLQAPASRVPVPREPSALWSPALLEAWVRSQGGQLDWLGQTPWGAGLHVTVPSP